MLPSVSVDIWRALGSRLREIGLTRQRAREITRVGHDLYEPLRPPLRAWHLQRLDDPAGYAMRLLMFGDPVRRDEAATALGASLIEPLLEAGFLVNRPRGRLMSPFSLNIVEDIYVVCDDVSLGGDAVMGAGKTTSLLCQAAYPLEPVGRVLDLGCGAGTAALLYASAGRAGTAVGVDVNQRAITLSRINAALNGVTRVEFRLGDLFEPVEGESFDLIVSQPPYVALPEGIPPATFLHGGRRGDELPLRVLAEVSRHLAPGGRALILVEWPVVDDEPLERRVRAAVGSSEVNVLLLRFPPSSVDDYAGSYAAAHEPRLDRRFERTAMRIRDHVEQERIRSLHLTLNVIRRAVGGEPPPWTATVDIPAESADVVTSARIEGLIAARDILAGGAESVLTANLGVPGGTIFAREHPVGEPDRATIRLRFRDAALTHPAELNPEALLLVTLVHEAPTVREAVEAYADRAGQTDNEAREAVLAAVRDALVRGILEPQEA